MDNRSIITVSTKGQIVLPIDIRKSLCLKEGDKLICEEINGSVCIKKIIETPKYTQEEIDNMFKESISWAINAGLKEEDVSSIIQMARDSLNAKNNNL